MFKNRLKELREQNKLTQKQLSEKINASKSKIAMWESGSRDPNSDDIIFLAKLFNVTTDYLLGYSDIPNFINPSQHNTQQFAKNEFLTSSEKKLIKLFQTLKTDKFKEKAIHQFESYIETLSELEVEFEELEDSGFVKPNAVQSTHSKKDAG